MRKISLLAIALVAGLCSQAKADYTAKNVAGSTMTFKSSGDCTSVVCVTPHYLTDSSGTAVGLVGAPIYVGFGTGVTLPAFAAIPAFKIDQTTPGTTNLVALTAETTKVIGTVRIASGGVAAGGFAAGSGVDGWDLTQGAIADAAATAGSTGSVSAKLRLVTSQLANIPAQGQALAAASTPVVLTAIQQAALTPPAAITGFATSANQTTAQTSLSAIAASAASIDTKASAPLPTQAASVIIGGVGIDQTTDGTTNGVSVKYSGVKLVADPCQQVALVRNPISMATAVNLKFVTGTASKKTYICGMMLLVGGTTNVAIVEGSGTNCGTSALGLIGGATAATGLILTAQAGFNSPPAGYAIATTTVNANDICLINSAAVQVSGYIVTATP